MSTVKTTIKFLLIASLPLGLTANRSSQQCLAGRKAAMIEGGFTGPLVCSSKDASFVLAGATVGGKFSVYDYRYRFLPHPGGVMHGGQKLVIFSGDTYVGQYMLSSAPFVDITVKGTDVVLRVGGKTPERVTLDFSRKPPKEIFVNGEAGEFYR